MQFEDQLESMPYLNVAQTEAALLLAASLPNAGFTQLIPLPNATWENRQCHAIRVGNGAGPGRPAVFLLGGVHAREWGSADILINFATQLTDAYRMGVGISVGARNFSAAEIRTIVDTLNIIVFPQANPDGRNYSMTVDAMWRKNRRVLAPNSALCLGVDINRNFDFLWDFLASFSPASGVSASSDPCDYEVYHGPSAFSEPETQNIKWLFDQFDVRFFIDLHSYGQSILHSWGDDENQSLAPSTNFRNSAYDGLRGVGGDSYREYIRTNDLSTAVNLANTLQSAIGILRGTTYVVKPGFSLYGTSGSSDDYSYSRHFVDPSNQKIIAYTLEWGTEFQPQYSEMQNIVQEITCGLLAFCLDICGRDDVAWQLTGNSGIDSNTQFLGTIDNQPLVVRTNGLERLRIASNGGVGVGISQPSAQLSVVAPGAVELQGSARSATLLTSAGGLGTNTSTELALATIGFLSGGGNSSSLGIRARRVTSGASWGSTAIGVGMDVDDTVGAGAYLWLHANGGIGIGTSQPSARLSVVAAGTSELAGSAKSTTLLATAGGLGTNNGTELALATLGFFSGGGNSSSLGIRARRVTSGASWGSTAIGVGMDVDDTVGAGAYLWLHANGGIGIGTSQPSARLSIVAAGTSELAGSAKSTTLLATAGGLGTNNGTELPLATLGFFSGGGNSSSLGIRARRVTNGASWGSTAIGVGMDVDDTVGAGAYLWLHANGGIGVGTSVPTARLSVIAPGVPDLGGSAKSTTLVTCAGNLGTTGGSQLALTTIGFLSGNSSSLGIRALRVANGASWTSTAIGVGMDVDDTAGAGAYVWLHANGCTGVGTAQPTARLSVVAGGVPELTGSVRSSAFLVSAGSLGAQIGNQLALGTLGFFSGSNNSSLGIRALRVANGASWVSTSVGLGMDVDDTPGAGAYLWLHANASVSIGTAVPSANRLSIEHNASDSFTLRATNTAGGGALAGVSNGGLFPSVVGLASGAGAGVHGHAAQTTVSSIGVIGTAGGPDPYLIDAAQAGGVGVLGHAGSGLGVGGLSDGLGTIGNNGVEGHIASGSGAGVYALASTANTVGVYGRHTQSNGTAGRFIGKVEVQGTLTASSKNFRIDHPLDPANKYLNHSSVESPEMINVYAGRVVTDSHGHAAVRLPDYFEALNRDHKYQLTVIGEFAQAVVEREIEKNLFYVRTDKPNVTVCWQVMGIRKDPYAEAHPIRVEEDKSDADRGRYLHRAVHEPASELNVAQSIGWLPSVLPAALASASRRTHTAE